MPQATTTTVFDLAAFLHRHRDRIIAEWVRRLHTETGPNYARRPVAELTGTVTEAFDKNVAFLVDDDVAPINGFIEKITRLRLETGFLLSDVQKAFEFFRSIALPLIAAQASGAGLLQAAEKINQCLAYTIHRFSDHFQAMHQRAIREHNRQLEEKVHKRTAELKESERKYKTLVEEINDGYFVIQGKQVVFANNAFCAMHGYSARAVIGKRFSTFVAPQSRNEVAVLTAGDRGAIPAPWRLDYLRLTRKRQCLPTELTAKATLYENRPSTIGICRDITQRVEMTQRVQAAERLAYIGQITTSLSHEIRNPLSAIKLNLQVLIKNPAITGNDRRRLEISTHQVARLEEALRHLLDFAKPMDLQPGPCDLNAVLAATIELLETVFEQKRLTVVPALDNAMPRVLADAQKIEQAVINLLLNACEASPPDGRIGVASRFHGEGEKPLVEITVTDGGPGIDAAQMDRIFEPFFSAKARGTGLGLANVKRIVDAHQGRVEAFNIAPHGACFRILLPAG